MNEPEPAAVVRAVRPSATLPTPPASASKPNANAVSPSAELFCPPAMLNGPAVLPKPVARL